MNRSLYFQIAFILSMFLFFGGGILGAEHTRLGGYGELHYNKPINGLPLAKSAGSLDFHRFVFFLGYEFNDWITFHSETEIEHTLVEGNEKTGEVSIEQAYVNLQYSRAVGLRAGIMLVPVGIINPVHEPPTFNGVERPNVEKYIIPTTWREAGVGLAGQLSNNLKYEAYLMAGLDPDGLSGQNGIRGARQNAFKSGTQDFALTGRLDYLLHLNLSLGASGYYSTLSRSAVYGDALDGAAFALAEVHALYSRSNFRARALWAISNISHAAKINNFYAGLSSSPGIGSSQLGWYLEAAYDVLGIAFPETEQRLFLFGRYENYNTQQSTSGFSADPDFHRKESTLGCTYLPVTNVALKMDYQFLSSAGSKRIRQFNLGVGYYF